MKLVLNEYNLVNPKIKNKLDIMCISDIHSDIERLKCISKLIEKLDIKTLLISGDLCDTINDRRNEELLKLVEDISKNTSIYIAKGNHDLIKLKSRKDRNYSSNSKFYKKIILLKNVKVFDENIDCISFNNQINISSLTLPIKWYNGIREDESKFTKYFKNDKKVDNRKFNILLSHTPRGLIVNNKIRQDLDYIKDMNFIICGHMHAGLRPVFLRRKKGHRGLVGPYITPFPKSAYGIYNNDGSSMLISGGITKLSDSSSGVIRFFDKCYKSEIELIHIMPGECNHLELSKRSNIKIN